MKHTRNSKIKPNASRWYALLALLGLLTMLLWPSMATAVPLTDWPSMAAVIPLSDEQELKQAWEYAADVGVYRYQTDVLQITHPTHKLVNVGRSSKTDRFSVAGMMDRPNDTMEMKIRGNSSIDLKVVDGVSYGRMNARDVWTQTENQSDFFAPGGDPLGYLNAAENIQEAGGRMQDAGSGVPDLDTVLANPYSVLGGAYSVYTFDLNGPKYARFMRDQMQDYLQRVGELPSGVDLGLANVYVGMQGHGEIWLDTETNLPVRQVIHLEFPPEQHALNWVEADITTDFSGWEEGLTARNQGAVALARLRDNPGALFTDPQSLFPNSSFLAPANVQQFTFSLGLSLFVLGFVALLISYRRSPKLYTAIALSLIFSMLATPLMQSNQTYAFYEKQRTKRVEHEQQAEQQREMENVQDELSGRNFDPHENPLASPTSNSPLGKEGQLFFSAQNTTADSSDLADLTDRCETLDEDSINSDNDGDGLSDDVECHKLGTDMDLADTDGDGISDYVEVAGFPVDTPEWYLNPLDPDSNGDGSLDSNECLELLDMDTVNNVISETIASGASCVDTDGDTIPDVFDFDNDGDGVPDGIDSSPDYYENLTTNAQSQFSLSLNGYATDTQRALVVDLQLRPIKYEHLYHTDNVLDWPTDTEGQMRRFDDATFFDKGSEGTRTAHGDMMTTPLLQITIPAPDSNPANPSGGLPVLTGVNAFTITNTSVLTAWLDVEALDEYQISVSQDPDNGTLYAYVPLLLVEDSVGDTPVAWAAQMLYRPEGSGWGGTHQMKLVWMVNALIDSCDTTDMPDSFTDKDGETVDKKEDDDAYDRWCEMETYTEGSTTYQIWQTNTGVIQRYYEDFYLTGLSVREHYGTDLAVIAQNDALTTTAGYEDHLWYLSNALQVTFGAGQLLEEDGDRRFDIAEIARRFAMTSTATIAEQ